MIEKLIKKLGKSGFMPHKRYELYGGAIGILGGVAFTLANPEILQPFLPIPHGMTPPDALTVLDYLGNLAWWAFAGGVFGTIGGSMLQYTVQQRRERREKSDKEAIEKLLLSFETGALQPRSPTASTSTALETLVP